VKSSKALLDSVTNPDPLTLAEQMIHVLPACHRLMVAAVHGTPHTKGMSLTQFRILKHLNEREHRATELASALEVGKSTLTISVDSLVRRGFVERSDLVGDRRASVLRITPSGEVLVRALEHRAAGGLASLLTQLTLDERKALSQGFDGLERALREAPKIVNEAEPAPVDEGEYE